MTTNRSSEGTRSYGRSSSSSASSSNRSTGRVSSAPLHQQSGTQHSFGGYTKIARDGGTFTMRNTGKSQHERCLTEWIP